MGRKIIFVLICIIFLVQCQSEPADSVETDDHDTSETIDEGIDEIFLNNNQKWEVPSTMHQIIINMQALVNNDGIDDQERSYGLNQLIGELTGSCTMEGQGHDELHKILIPLIEGADSYETGDNTEKSLTEIKRLLSLYDDFFESE
jgi:hypothetical protein